MKTFPLQILGADNPFYKGECESIIVPTLDGKYGILAHHKNIIAAIVPGILHYKLPGKEYSFASISHGLVKVENGEVLILVDSVERPEEIDANRARKAAAAAKEAILQKRSVREYHIAQARLARAMNRLRVKKRSMR